MCIRSTCVCAQIPQLSVSVHMPCLRLVSCVRRVPARRHQGPVGHLSAFGSTAEMRRLEVRGYRGWSKTCDPSFGHKTGPGRVAEHRGDYFDAINNQKSKVVIVLVEALGGKAEETMEELGLVAHRSSGLARLIVLGVGIIAPARTPSSIITWSASPRQLLCWTRRRLRTGPLPSNSRRAMFACCYDRGGGCCACGTRGVKRLRRTLCSSPSEGPLHMGVSALLPLPPSSLMTRCASVTCGVSVCISFYIFREHCSVNSARAQLLY